MDHEPFDPTESPDDMSDDPNLSPDDVTADVPADVTARIASALRDVEAPSAQVTERNISAALAVFDELSVGRTDRRRRRFSPSSLIGAAAAVLIVVAGAAVVIDRGQGRSSDDSVSPADEAGDEATMEMFSLDEPRAATERSEPAPEIAAAGPADDDVGVDMGDLMADSDTAGVDPDLGAMWLGEIDVDLLEPSMLDRLARSVEMGDPCADSLDSLVGFGTLEGLDVVVGLVGDEALALDIDTCAPAALGAGRGAGD